MRDQRDEMNESDIRKMFENARRMDAERAPSFHETLRARREMRRWWHVRSSFIAAAAACFAGIVVVVVAHFSKGGVAPAVPPPAPAAITVFTARLGAMASPRGTETLADKKAAAGINSLGRRKQDLQTVAGFTSIGPPPSASGNAERLMAAGWRAHGVAGGASGGIVGGVPGGVLGGDRSNAISRVLALQQEALLAQAKTMFADGFIENDATGMNTESYGLIRENEFLATRENPLSTFSIDVDTASYSVVRLHLDTGRLPPPAAVRIEELINYFPYDDPPPNGDAPFATRVEIAGCPWNANHRLARIALKAQDVSRHSRPASNLVFLIDVSGSMNEPTKLPLVISSLKQLVAELDGRDRIAIAVYAGGSGLVLPPTAGSDRGTILSALDRLQAGGGTNGGEGLLLAYQTARKGLIPGGTNRVILATDGDFNLGVTDRTQLLDMITRESGGGIFLTALGFGMGNYKDDFLETLADKGNGNYAYIDSPREARKVLVEGMGGTLVTVAKDVKIQVEFNPARVESYRLIGYENRLLAKEDFNDDTKDAGEIGAGHSVTALYELVPAGSSEKAARSVNPLKYQKSPAPSEEAVASDETLTVKLRYKEPEGKESKLLEVPAVDSGLSARAASADFKFAASVAMFGMTLRSSPHRGNATLEGMQKLAAEGLGRDPGGYRADFLRLAGIAAGLRGAPDMEGAREVQPVTP